MLGRLRKKLFFLCLLGPLALTLSCGKSSSSSPTPVAKAWDGLSDQNSSDLKIKDIEP